MELQVINGVSCYEENGTAYLRLEDVARGLGFTEIAASGNECVRWRTVRKYLSELGIATSCDGKLPDYIPENIFYRLAMKAKNETAEKFQALVADEIIPSIRKTGGYILGQENMSDTELLARAVQVSQKIIEERNKEIAALEIKNLAQTMLIEELQPKADYVDMILKNKGLVSITQIAKDYGMSGIEMNKILHDLKIQYKQGKQWLLYKQYQNNGYTHSETFDITRKDGNKDISMLTKWTQKGRLFLYDKLKANGYRPMIEVD